MGLKKHAAVCSFYLTALVARQNTNLSAARAATRCLDFVDATRCATHASKEGLKSSSDCSLALLSAQCSLTGVGIQILNDDVVMPGNLRWKSLPRTLPVTHF